MFLTAALRALRAALSVPVSISRDSATSLYARCGRAELLIWREHDGPAMWDAQRDRPAHTVEVWAGRWRLSASRPPAPGPKAPAAAL